MTKRPARHQLNEPRSRISTPLAMDAVTQPTEERCEIALGERLIEVAQLCSRPLEQLGRDQIAEGIGWEITDQPAGPMSVL